MMAAFLLKLTAGIVLMWLLMPRREVTDGFFRIQMRVVLGLSVLAALVLAADTTWPSGELAAESAAHQRALQVGSWIRWLCVAAAVVSYFGTVFWALGRRLPGTIAIYLLTLLCTTALIVHSVCVPNRSSVLLQICSDLSSAAVLGSVLTGMLLGHWYLTTPTMSIRPLSWFNRAIVVAGIMRMSASLWSLGEFGIVQRDTTALIWLVLRWVGGIVTPLVVGLMVWQILKHRNTQSATGVLFAGLVLVFMGEMTALLLERQALVPY